MPGRGRGGHAARRPEAAARGGRAELGEELRRGVGGTHGGGRAQRVRGRRLERRLGQRRDLALFERLHLRAGGRKGGESARRGAAALCDTCGGESEGGLLRAVGVEADTVAASEAPLACPYQRLVRGREAGKDDARAAAAAGQLGALDPDDRARRELEAEVPVYGAAHGDLGVRRVGDVAEAADDDVGGADLRGEGGGPGGGRRGGRLVGRRRLGARLGGRISRSR